MPQTVSRSDKQDRAPATSAGDASRFMRSIWALAAKDVRCELRSRQAITAMLLFALTSVVAVSATVGRCGLNPDVAAGLLWLVIYFSAMSGLSRSLVREEELQTASLLKLTLSPNAVYLGKLTYNFAVLLAVEIVVVPLLFLLGNCSVGNWPGLIVILVFGTVALSAAGTIAAAMVARATVKGALYAVLTFPLLAPVLFAAVHGSEATIAGAAAPPGDIRLLAYYCGTVITGSLLLFRFVWED